MRENGRRRGAFTPLVGLMIALILGVIAWFAAPVFIEWLARLLPNFRGNELPLSTMRPVFTAIIVVLALVIFGLLAALMTPKDTQTASEAQLEKERDALRRQQKAQRAEDRKPKGSK